MKVVCNQRGGSCPINCRHVQPHEPITFPDGEKSCEMDYDCCGEFWKGKGYATNCICVKFNKEAK